MSSNQISEQISRRAQAEHGLDFHDLDNQGSGLWQPLKYEDSFRLFKLWRDQASSLLQFELSEYRLAQAPDYKAVSYVWGQPGNVGIIECQQGYRALRRNLFALLNVLCNRMAKGELDGQTYLWVDAICIDQESFSEKAQQVQQIGDVFMKASEVLVWLGMHPEKGGSCLDPVWTEYAKTDDPWASIWDHVSTHNYWTRTWVVQEFVLAQRVVLFDDVHWLFYDDLANKQLLYQLRGSASFYQSMGVVCWARGGRSGIVLGGSRDLITNVRMLGEKKCTDQRDMVYAVRSLCTDSSRLKVDYRISVACLFWRLICGSSDTWKTYRLIMEVLQLDICHILGLAHKCTKHRTDENSPKSLISDEEQENHSVRLHLRTDVSDEKILLLDGVDVIGCGEAFRTNVTDSEYKVLCGRIRRKDHFFPLRGDKLAFIIRYNNVINRTSPEYNIVALAVSTGARRIDNHLLRGLALQNVFRYEVSIVGSVNLDRGRGTSKIDLDSRGLSRLLILSSLVNEKQCDYCMHIRLEYLQNLN